MTPQELRQEKLDEMREDLKIESRIAKDYDFAFEQIVVDSNELFQIQLLVNELASRLDAYGWVDIDKIKKDILEEI